MQIKRYFAAANGYDGFKSYFNKIFNPTEYERLYVLKGGPGTGKSSLMKKIESCFDAKGLECEGILCSSDPESFDGVIVKNGNIKVGVLDGTAPHETDARFPGAIDEIVNLGAMWSSERLVEKRNGILELNREKNTHYKNAYEFLSLAGEFSARLDKTLRTLYNCNSFAIDSDIFENVNEKNRKENVNLKLISSFGKCGYKRIDTKNVCGKRNFSVTGKYGSEFLFMSQLINKAEANGAEYMLFPSPYSDKITEAVYFPKSDTFFDTHAQFDNVIDTAEYLNYDMLNFEVDRLEYYTKELDYLLSLAQKEFSKASEAHFKLEKIYTAFMDFDGINEITNRLIDDISKTLSGAPST